MAWRVVLWTFLALIGLLMLALILPVGIRVRYGKDGLKLWYAIGPVRILHRAKGTREKSNSKSDFAIRNILHKPNSDKKDGNVLENFWADLKVILDLFGHLQPKLRVKLLELKLCLAGDSPAVIAMLYGGAWSAIGLLVPILEEAFVIKKKDLDVLCDFEGEATTLNARLDISIGLGRLLFCLIRYAICTLDNKEPIHTERR